MKVCTEEFTAPNGVVRRFHYREDTNDRDIITSCYCEDEYGILSLGLGAGDKLIDVGAHIGAVTALMLTVPGVDVIAIEPLPENLDLLERNAQGAVVHHAGLWVDKEGIEVQYRGGTDYNDRHRFIGDTVGARHGPPDDSQQKVTATTMTLEELVPCTFMKMDIEGAEVNVFKGTPWSVLRQIKRIHGECHGITNEELWGWAKGIFRNLSDLGYEEKAGHFKYERIGGVN